MKCRKEIVLTGYRVQYIDLREPKPRAIKQTVHAMERQWLDALALTGRCVADNIREQYERIGCKVFHVVAIKQKRVAELDLCQLWEAAEPAATERQADEMEGNAE